MAMADNKEKVVNIVSLYTANEPRFVKHERIEFLERLARMDDPKLREIGIRGMNEIINSKIAS